MKRQTALLFIASLSVVCGLPQPADTAATFDLNAIGLTNSYATLSCAPDASPAMVNLTRLLPKIFANAESSSTKSWEIGTLQQALLETYDPHFTPFEWDKAAVRNRPIPWNVFEITKAAMVDYDWSGSPDETTTKDASRTQQEPEKDWLAEYLSEDPPFPVKNLGLIPADGAQGDACSLGPAVWMMAQMADRQEVKERGGFKRPEEYAWAVGNQKLNLTLGPQDDGTYSQRADEFAIWADMGYMIPPFLAHLGLATNSSDLLRDAIDSIKNESRYILNPENKPETNIYLHVNQDWGNKYWATGNGWMTYGLMRVIASIHAAGKQDEFKTDLQTRLAQVGKVFKALFAEINDESLLPNNMLDATTHDQGESAGTALVLAAFYRYAVIAPNAVDQAMRDKAEVAFAGVTRKLGEDGWLTQVVDPHGSNGFEVTPGGHSPEGQSFLGMLWAARTAVNHFDSKTKSIASGIEQAVSSTSSSASSVQTSGSSSSEVPSAEVPEPTEPAEPTEPTEPIEAN